MRIVPEQPNLVVPNDIATLFGEKKALRVLLSPYFAKGDTHGLALAGYAVYVMDVPGGAREGSLVFIPNRKPSELGAS